MVSYEKKFVLFIDILGFKELIKDNSADFIFDVLSIFKKSIEECNFVDISLSRSSNQGFCDINIDNNGDIEHGKIIGDDVQITSFSDNIVITINNNVDVLSVLQYIATVQEAFLKENISKEITIRGGLTIGEIYHQENIVFGPALNDAYELESKKARYSRIMLSKEFTSINTTFSQYFIKDKEEDECSYFDFIKFHLENFGIDEEFQISLVSAIAELDKQSKKVQKLHETKENEEIIEKTKWLKEYLTQGLDAFNKLIAKHEQNRVSRINECLAISY